jgi:hypothetical protein
MRVNLTALRAIPLAALALSLASLSTVEAWDESCPVGECMFMYEGCIGSPQECPPTHQQICSQTCWDCGDGLECN